MSFRTSAWRQWFHLGLAVIAMLYVLFAVMMLAVTSIFTYVGIDYRNTLCTLRFVYVNGFQHAYDPALQAQFYQTANAALPEYAACDTPPNPYLPVFQALFVPLVLIPPVPGYVLWTVFNVALFALYCYRFKKAVGAHDGAAGLPKLLLAYALYENLMAGQFNVPLFVCFGECILAYLRGQPLRSGAWLAGMLLKPQVLLLILPGLLIGRRLRLLLGFTLASLALGIVSLGLSGVDGLLDLLRLFQLYGGGAPPTFPEAGMNWRGLAINLTPLLGAPIAWAVAIPGLVLTLAAGLAVWLAPRRGNPDDQFVVAMLGSFAATSAVTWHSHVYSGLPVLAPLLYLTSRGRLPEWLFNAWLVLPAAAFFVSAFGVAPKAGHTAAGLAMLAVNVALVAWATRTLWRPDGAPTTTPLDAAKPGLAAL